MVVLFTGQLLTTFQQGIISMKQFKTVHAKLYIASDNTDLHCLIITCYFVTMFFVVSQMCCNCLILIYYM